MLIFLEVPSPDCAVSRVAMRVSMGVHNIPATNIRRRDERALALSQSTYVSLVDIRNWYRWNGQVYEIYQQSPKVP